MPESYEQLLVILAVATYGALIGFPKSPIMMCRAGIVGTAFACASLYFLGGTDELMPLAIGMFAALNATVFEPVAVKALKMVTDQFI